MIVMNGARRLCIVGLVSALCAAGCGFPVLQMQPTIPNGGRAVAVAVHPTNAARIIVASETGGLFLTTNGGVDWTHVSGSSTFGYADVLYVPTNPSVVVAAAQQDMRVPSGGGIWRSTNGGATWSKATMSPPTPACTNDLGAFALAFDAASGRLWAGTVCGLASSMDLGATWQYLAPGTGYSYVPVYAVLTPSANQIKILTDAGVRVSGNGGVSWTLSNAGLPGSIVKGVHNQLGVSPKDANHLYWAFNHWSWNAATSSWDGMLALYRSTDNGASWSQVIDVGGYNRPPFVKVAQASLAGAANTYDLYFSDGGCGLKRTVVTHGTAPTFATWTPLSVDHCDPADLGFSTNQITPLLLLSDGGLHTTANNGLTWTFIGAAGHGYGALQITEVTGQLHTLGSSTTSDLYFGTQDNDVWGSADGGATWTGRRCCEGFFLNVWRDPLPPADTRVSGVTCAGCGNFISGTVLAAQGGFPNPPNNTGNPRLVAPAAYVQSTAVPGLSGNIFNLTTNNGGAWVPRYGFAEPVRDLSHVAGTAAAATVFTAVKYPGVTPNGQEMLGIKRVTDVLGSGTPVVFDITGFGSLGIFATMFAWYKPFGVDPNDANHLIVSDIIDQLVKVSTDGGGTWRPDSLLTRLVTESGSLRFRSGPFTQITAFGFDVECTGHMVVGTIQAGMFESFNDGGTWAPIPNSTVVSYISGFFFPRKGLMMASSYGRGLWRIFYKCPKKKPFPHLTIALAEPTIYWKGARVPISQLKNPDACPVCSFVLMEQGRILDYVLDQASGRIEEVRLSGGRIRGYSWDRTPVDLPFRTAIGQQQGTFSSDTGLVALLYRERSAQVKGLFVEGSILKGVILAAEDVKVSQLPEKQAPRPEIRIDSPSLGGIPADRAGRLVLRGSAWDPNAPIEVQLDGEVLRLEQPPRPDGRGEFSIAIPPVGVGGHTIIVRQRTPRGVLQDAYTFNVTVQDMRQEQR